MGRYVLACSLMILSAGLLAGCPGGTTGIYIEVLYTPYSVPTAPGNFLAYELLLSDYRTDGSTLTSVDILGDGKLLKSYPSSVFTTDDPTAEALLMFPDPDKIPLGSDQKITKLLLLFSVPLSVGEKAPASISHVLHLERGGKAYTARGGTATVSTDPIIAIESPLGGTRMVAFETLSPAMHHRKSLTMTKGKFYISQRFAVDWFRLTEKGRMTDGSSDGNTAHASYGMDIVAAAPGTVVRVKEGVPDNTPPGRAVEMTTDTVAGNLVVVKIADNRYAFYGHCIPGSIVVKEGNTVATGQKLARLGNSGNSDMPHLHFQIADGISLFDAQGVPFVIPGYTYTADYPYWTFSGGTILDMARNFTWIPLGQPVAETSRFFANGNVTDFGN